MLRIGVGGLMHESNSFAPGRTTIADFESGGLEVGDAIRSRWGAAHHEMGGVIESLDGAGVAVALTLMGWATPAGPLNADSYQELRDRLIRAIEAAGHVDAFVVCLHGAMVADDVQDADGELIASLRQAIGPEVPLIVTLDFHGNISPLLVDHADAVLAYRTYPHVDQRERGAKAGRIAVQAARREIRPVTALCKPPLMVSLLRQTTSNGPFSMLMQEAIALEQLPGVLDLSLMAGFPYADVEAMGVSCLVVTDQDRDLASRLTNQVASSLWNSRRELVESPVTPQEAVRMAIQSKRHPVLLVDLGDNIGGGSAADSTVLVHELRLQGATNVVAVIHDPDAVRSCVEARLGGEVKIDVGGKVDQNARPYRVEGRVACLHDGRYEEAEARHGGIRHNDQGDTAVIATNDGDTLVVNSLRHPPFSLGQLTSLDIDPRHATIIVVKAAVAFRAAYEPIAGEIIEVDTPGLTASNAARYTYLNARRPLYPLDADALWEPCER